MVRRSQSANTRKRNAPKRQTPISQSRKRQTQKHQTQKRQTHITNMQKKTKGKMFYQLFKPCNAVGDARQWCNNTNINNFINMWNEGEPMKLHYRLINLFLLVQHYPSNSGVKRALTRMINNMKDYAPDRKNIAENLVSHIADSVKRLYLMIKNVPPMINYISNPNSSVMLYHGSMLPNLKTLSVGDTYITPIFMSTSLIRDVAIRFARTNPSSADTDVVLRILVPPNKLGEFQYMYFGKLHNTTKCNHIEESEILMNLHSKLKMVKIHRPRKVDYKVYGCIGKKINSKTAEKIVTYFDFTFLGHSNETINKLLPKKL